MDRSAARMEDERILADDMQEDLDLCNECAGTWKVACYGAWSPNSQFWEDFLEDGWEEGAYTPRACCLRVMCGCLFLFFAPIWCCKAILFFLFWPCICCCRAVREGNCNKEYFRLRHRKGNKRLSQPLAYIEAAQPSCPNEISYQFAAPKGIPPESPIPEIRIETELENGTYVTSPVEDSDVHFTPTGIGHRRLPTITVTGGPATMSNGRALPATNGRSSPVASWPQPSSADSNGYHSTNNRPQPPLGPSSTKLQPRQGQQEEAKDPPPSYSMSESPMETRVGGHRSRSSTHPTHTSTKHSPTNSTSPSTSTHPTAKKTMSSKARGMDNNFYKAVVMEGFQGITGKVTTV